LVLKGGSFESLGFREILGFWAAEGGRKFWGNGPKPKGHRVENSDLGNEMTVLREINDVK